MKTLFLFLFLSLHICAKNFTVATYNIENLFDLNHNGTEYQEYIPHKTNWNHNTLTVKLNHISNVITSMNPDIIALQEVESKEALMLLKKTLPQYAYADFIKNQNAAIGLGILSKYKITQSQAIPIKSNSTFARPIQKVMFTIDNHSLTLFNNHWSSKKVAESKRIEYALSLKTYLDTLPESEDYILVGDFNSNYDEYLSFKNDKKLNDSYNITGINQILNTSLNQEFVQKEHILEQKENVHYNLWLDLPYEKRFSYKFRNHNETPDNIIVAKALFDEKNISYVPNSFKVYQASYLFDGNKVKRWEVKNGFHQNRGYSDHLPIMATFSTEKYKTPLALEYENRISFLYKINHLEKSLKLNDVIVIYKNNDSAILKQKNDRAIYAYGCAKELKLGMSYDIEVETLSNYFGLKEIKSLKITNEKKEYQINEFYLDANNIDLLNLTYQNEIITHLSGIFYDGYLKFNHHKIRIYAKDKTLLPKNGQKITIMSGHLGFYKSNVQIILYKKSDIRVN
ncbi:MAG: endonuclease/exonuclease/phosphatase family protein [Candidatus Marinarcus sp.]|uniref:endonuclease/exonuclease/phosphatase family protein n=1 Tax=Candidatus Marinarcus sp. TaxID=3100987 RepID=UPI003AFF9B33